MLRWAKRFRRGTVRLQGTVPNGAVFGPITFEEGSLEMAFTFAGGVEPTIKELALLGSVRVNGHKGTALDADLHGLVLDGERVGEAIPLDHLTLAVVEVLADVEIWVEVIPDGELLVKFQHGVQVVLNSTSVITLTGAAEGPPNNLTLSQPIDLNVDGDGLRLSHRRFRRLASLASLRLEGASLHPNGEVRLRGGASRGLDRVVRGGLEKASARLSDLVRRSPRFARVRSFLKRSG